ncbi:MAG: STAS domain-containing protein [Planctomycetales bacterium]|nr:STAS domain-containing protein [Planctomycetales bacterium]
MSAIKTRIVGDVLVVAISDSRILDQSQIEQIGYDLLQTVSTAPAGKVVLTLAGVEFMGSAMIGKIIQFNKKCKEAEAVLHLCSISANILEVFKVMRLQRVLKIFKDEESAIGGFDKKGWFG